MSGMCKGRPVAGGIGIGPAVRWSAPSAAALAADGAAPAVGGARSAPQPLVAEAVAAELARLEEAVQAARATLQALRDAAAAHVGSEGAAILEAQLLMLDDPALIGEAAHRIRSERLAAPFVLAQVGEEMAALLASLDDPYLRERAADVRDVTGRVLRQLAGDERVIIPHGCVLVAADLPPSELLGLAPGQVAGLALAAGGATSHTAIVARTLGIPAVMGLGAATGAIPAGAILVVDGEAGLVAVNPAPDVLAQYQQRLVALAQEWEQFAALRHLPAETQDGHRVLLAANIGSAQDAVLARAEGAQGVGLFRTEFLFLERSTPPTEEEQVAVYREALAAMAPYPVLIRTLDIGGDKPLPYLQIPPEENPFLGLRGIRLCQAFVDLFRTQLRAMMRAAAHGRVQMMVPMVATQQEVRWVREQLAAARAEVGDAAGDVELGIMIETPAAALLAAELAPLVDFFSIGTNDLTQYTLAVDRLNPRVAGLYDPYHPAVLRLIRLVVQGAHSQGRWVGMCGELAGDARATALLLGLGLDELSMSAPSLARVKGAVRVAVHADAVELAGAALACSDGDAVRRLLGVQ